MKIQKKKWGVGRGGVGLGFGLGVQGGCERIIEVFVKIKKKWGGGRVWGSGWGFGFLGSRWM